MRALIYARVSADVKGRGRSVAEQTDECTAFCNKQGWTVAETFTDNDRSASRHAKRTRPEWAKVKEIISSGSIDILVTWEASRAQRDLTAYTELRDLCAAAGVRWAYSGTIYDFTQRSDRLRTGMDALMAEDEADRTQERVLRAVRASALKGQPHGRRPYGYRRVYNSATGELVTQEPEPLEAVIVEEAARRFLAGESARSIANDFTRRQVPMPSGGRWDLSRIRRLLTNPTYNGKRVHLGQIVGAGGWPAILDDDTFNALAARFADPSRTTTRRGPNVRLLSGVARCGVCGGAMTYAKQGGRGRTVRLNYICRYNHCVARDMPMLDEYVTEVVLERFRRPDATNLATPGPNPAVSAAMNEAVELRLRLDDGITEFTAGRLSAAALGRIESDLLPRIADAERRARVAGLPTVAVDLAAAADPATVWEALTVEQRREILRALVEVVVDRVPVVGRRGLDHEAIRIEWRQ